jgi:hypothetical protein
VIEAATGLCYPELVGGWRGPCTMTAYHLNPVNGLHVRRKAYIAPFIGSKIKHLDGYAR